MKRSPLETVTRKAKAKWFRIQRKKHFWMASFVVLGLMVVYQNCGSSNPNTLQNASTATSTGELTSTVPTVSNYFPVPGAYNQIPTSVFVNFSTTMEESTVTDVEYWDWACTGKALAHPTSVTLSGQVATVTLPAESNLTHAVDCTLSLLTEISDADWNALADGNSVSYSAAIETVQATNLTPTQLPGSIISHLPTPTASPIHRFVGPTGPTSLSE